MATNRPERIEEFAAQEQSAMAAALERAQFDLAERDAPAGHFGLLVALVPRPRQLVVDERVDEAPPLLAAQVGGSTVHWDLALPDQLLSEPVGHVPRHGGDRQAGRRDQFALPLSSAQVAPARTDEGPLSARGGRVIRSYLGARQIGRLRRQTDHEEHGRCRCTCR